MCRFFKISLVLLAALFVVKGLLMALPLETSAPKLALVPAQLPKPGNLRRFLIIKRWMDIFIASFFLIVFAPLMLIIALLIKLTSPGPAVVRSYRVGSRVRGKGGRRSWEMRAVNIYRFRTFARGEPSAAVDQASTDPTLMGKTAISLSDSNIFTRPTDIPLGHFLRRTRLDNLPQLFNVLKGEISLVGPQPVKPEEVESYTEHELRRFEAQAGLTGWWQVTCNWRGPKSRTAMIEKDIWYVDHQSLKRDVKILLLTPIAILMGNFYD